MKRKPTYEELERKLEELERKVGYGSEKINVSGINIEWNAKQGTCTFENLPVAMMWVDTTLAGLMSGVQAMVGTERFGLALQSEGRKSVEDDWQIISQFSDFRDGFKIITNIAAVAGWGKWELASLDENKKKCQFRVKNSWEGHYQKSLGVCWNSGMLAGKMAGYCSKLFETNCWAKQTAFIAKGDDFDEFVVAPSERSIEKEIENLLVSDEATRADMAVALKKLKEEVEDRKRAEDALRKSEAALKSIFQAAPTGIGSLSDRVIKRANEKLCEMLGYSREEMLGRSSRMLYPTDEEFEYVGHEKYDQIHEKGIGAIETRLRRKDGNVIDVLLSSAPLDPKDSSIGVTFTVLDVTDRKQSERELRKSEQKYRLLVESTPDWVWICDEEGLQTFSNQAVKQILGYEVQEILGASVFNLMHPEDRKRVQKWFQNAKNQKRGWRGAVIRWQHKDKSLRFLETIAGPILDTEGNLIGFTGIDRDVTARKQSEQALQEAHDELKERTIDLDIKSKNLKEINTAMKVLLKKREADKAKIEDYVLSNITKLIEPYFKKIKKTGLNDQQRALLKIIELNLNEIISPFVQEVSLKYFNLTPTEIQIAKQIVNGDTTKKIAAFMNISPRTVETHRKNIRRKTGLEGKKANLRSHLLAMN